MENNSQMPATLVLQNISMYYHGGNTVVPGIVGVNLEFHMGEFVVITGESGSGKSTLLNIISALAPYHDGEMYINGVPTSAYGEEEWEEYRREHIGFIFQDYQLIQSYSVLENVTSAVLLRGIGKAEADRLAREYIERVGLGSLLHRKAAKLSSGQKQRLAIARALAKDTDIIVADEPTGNLDSENGKQIVELLASLSKEKLILMVSHNMEEANTYADRRIRIHAGHVVADQKIKRQADETSGGGDERQDSTAQNGASSTTQSSTEQNGTAQHGADRNAGHAGRSRNTDRGTALRLAFLNAKAQPLKTFLTVFFLLLCTLASGVFAAGYLAASDDTATRTYTSAAFRNGNGRRIVVAREDGDFVNMEDVEFLRTLSYVEQVELYDIVADVNYYSVYGEDYYILHTYQYYEGPWSGPEERPKTEILLPEMRNHTKFMKSVTCITEEDLAAGTLPDRVIEVVYGSDPALIGTVMEVVLSDKVHWGENQHVTLNVEISGVLKDDDGQMYFSEQICWDYLNSDRNIWGFPRASVAGNDTMPEFDLGDIDLGDIDFSDIIISLFPEGIPNYDIEPKQITLYIKDYAYTDDVLRALRANGYLGISPLRASSVAYNEEKVREQLVTLFVCLAAFISVYFLEVLILKAFMKFKKGDYQVLRAIGMTQRQMRKMVLSEFLLSGGIAVFLAGAAAVAAWFFGGELLYDTMKYLRWYHYAGLILLESAAVLVLAYSYGGYLRRQFRTNAAGKSR